MANLHKLDCSGLVCPLPVAKTKRRLLEMKSGEILEINGDFAEAGENIKRYVGRTEDKILESKTEGDNFNIKIQKA